MQTHSTINFRFRLNARYFISIVTFLYMFRAHLCPSSGGSLFIYNIWFYVSLFWWPYSWKVGEGLPHQPSNCTVTKRDWHRTRCCKYTEVLLRMGTSVRDSLTNLLTVRSPKETDIEPDVVNIQRSSWGWPQVRPKHVEEHNYRNKILCIKLESEVNLLYVPICPIYASVVTIHHKHTIFTNTGNLCICNLTGSYTNHKAS